MIFWLYNLLLTVTAVFWLPLMAFKAARRKGPVKWSDRFGDFEIPVRLDGKRVWVHAVSVGEVIACLPVLERVRAKLPDFEIVLSVSTPGGLTAAEQRAKPLVDFIVQSPIEILRAQVAAFSRVRPAVVVLVETELWFNFLWTATRFGAKTLIVNGRLSDRSFQKSRAIRFFYKAMFRWVDVAMAQTEIDADRFRAYGAREVVVAGNTKFDENLNGPSREEWLSELSLDPSKPVIVVGSTRHADEEDFVIAAIESIGLESVQVIHAPRHIERAAELSEKVKGAFGSAALRSKGETGPYLILDTFGELSLIYAVADIAVIGGSFVPLGGQNLIQPLANGVPVIHGPYMDNFAAIARESLACGASVAVEGSNLSDALGPLLQDTKKRVEMSRSALSFVAKHRGAADRYTAEIVRQATENAPRIARTKSTSVSSSS